MTQVFNQVSYGLTQPLITEAPAPIIAKRAPTVNDVGYALGQLWIEPKNTSNVAQNLAWVLTSVINNKANWLALVGGGGAGSFASLVVTPGPISLTGTTSINTTGSAVTTIGTGGTGAVNIGNATGNTAVTGTLSATGTIASSAGAVNAFLSMTAGGTITSTSGNIVASVGNITASNGTVTGDTGVIATAGNITATDGNVVLSTAGTYISMPGPVFIYSGSGAPSNGLAIHVGDMYINTTAASATTRLYIATAASTWTNVTCAA